MQNISDCSISEYRSIVAFVTRNGSACHLTIYTYKDGLFQLSTSFKIFRQKLHLLVFIIIKSVVLLQFTNPSERSTFNVRLVPPFLYKGGQVTKPIILVKICYKLMYVIQGVENSFGKATSWP